MDPLWLSCLTETTDRNVSLVLSLQSQEAEKKASAQLEVPFSFSLGPQPIEWCYQHSEGIFPPQLHLSGNSLTGMPRVCLLGDSKSCQVDNHTEHEHEHISLYLLLPL